MSSILLGSHNTGKIREIKALLRDLPLDILAQDTFNIPSVEETGLSFIENALLKARHGALYSQLPCIAEDSGLCVEALQGAPGIYSARYAGIEASSYEHKAKLLNALKDIPFEKRQAYYYCAFVMMKNDSDPTPFICQGKWQGYILTEPKGQEGFGYDALFFIPDLNCTAAELSLTQKNQYSHRSKALEQLKHHLKSLYCL